MPRQDRPTQATRAAPSRKVSLHRDVPATVRFVTQRLCSERWIAEQLNQLGCRIELPPSTALAGSGNAAHTLDRLGVEQLTVAECCVREAAQIHLLHAWSLRKRCKGLGARAPSNVSRSGHIPFVESELSYLALLSRTFDAALPMTFPTNFSARADVANRDRAVVVLRQLVAAYWEFLAVCSARTSSQLRAAIPCAMKGFVAAELAPGATLAGLRAVSAPLGFRVVAGVFTDRHRSVSNGLPPTDGERAQFMRELLRRVAHEGYPPFLRASRTVAPTLMGGGGPETDSATRRSSWAEPATHYLSAVDLPAAFKPRAEHAELINQEIVEMMTAHCEPLVVIGTPPQLLRWMRDAAIPLGQVLQEGHVLAKREETSVSATAPPPSAEGDHHQRDATQAERDRKRRRNDGDELLSAPVAGCGSLSAPVAAMFFRFTASSNDGVGRRSLSWLAKGGGLVDTEEPAAGTGTQQYLAAVLELERRP